MPFSFFEENGRAKGGSSKARIYIFAYRKTASWRALNLSHREVKCHNGTYNKMCNRRVSSIFHIGLSARQICWMTYLPWQNFTCPLQVPNR